jgi:predicted MFS family arabinose efflux permease
MTHRQLKAGYFTLTGLNTLASCYYFNYLFFFFRDHFGFGNRENLWASALYGVSYMVAAWQSGRFAARFGRGASLKTGFLALTVLMVAGTFLTGAMAQIILLAVYGAALTLVWPTLETLISERETQSGVQAMVGIYNCIWAGAAAFAYFTGGKLYDELGAGAVFWLPAGIYLGEFALASWLERHHAGVLAATPEPPKETHEVPASFVWNQPVSPQSFLKMAWLANPFAYIAINTLIAVMPGIAHKLALSPTQAGLFCSVWFFGRFGAFGLFWQWCGWHYRFRWLLGAFGLLIASLAAILLAQQLWLVIVAQVFFGLATGLIYYSSLFYSMDVGKASSENGGLHEAFIGAGTFLGPATGAAALTLAPHSANVATWAVSSLLTAGFCGLIWLRLHPAKKMI